VTVLHWSLNRTVEELEAPLERTEPA
jgi:hypothetical protein